MTVLGNDHLLVTMLLDICWHRSVPTLRKALEIEESRDLFRSTERLESCSGIYKAARVDHLVELDIDFGKPVHIAYHTQHIVSDTLKGRLREGGIQSIVGLIHDKSDRFEIEPLVIGAPWLDHSRNGKNPMLMWIGRNYGEILPEDIAEFSEMKSVTAESVDEWMNAMKKIPEEKIKRSFAKLLNEPVKKDWSGEFNDHFSSNVTISGRRRTAAFLLKGPSKFGEMTLDMCGKRADQIHRLADSGADISIVQHCHQIGEIVRRTLRRETVYPGEDGRRKYCLIDGQATYRILKAYNLLEDKR